MKTPIALLLLLIPIFLFVLELCRLKKKTNFFYNVSFYREKNKAASVFRIKQIYLASLYAIGMIFFIIALSNPYVISGTRDVISSKPAFTKDTIFLFDISQSMLADDGDNLTRLERSKRAATSIVAAGDGRFGIVVFKGEAFTKLPLTSNKNIVINTINNLHPDLFSAPGTDVGRGLLRAVESFPSHENTDKRLYLFTDAEEPDKGSFPRLRNAIRDAIIENNISLYIIPPNKKTGSPVPDRDVISVPDMEMVNTLARLPNSSVVSFQDLSRTIPLSLSPKGRHAEYSFSLFFSFMGFIIFIAALLLRGIKWQNII
ncbi:MAG: VWA domain-containing protein [Spirochaetes bacterium]|nr:VWA domain-containing protein [Spirochaetota bacterium]